jgi:hypothetical protein
LRRGKRRNLAEQVADLLFTFAWIFRHFIVYLLFQLPQVRFSLVLPQISEVRRQL